MHSRLDKALSAGETSDLSYNQGAELFRKLIYHQPSLAQIDEETANTVHNVFRMALQDSQIPKYVMQAAALFEVKFKRRCEDTTAFNLNEHIDDAIMEANVCNFLGDQFWRTCGRTYGKYLKELETNSSCFSSLLFPDVPLVPSVRRALKARNEITALLEQEIQRRRKQTKEGSDKGVCVFVLLHSFGSLN